MKKSIPLLILISLGLFSSKFAFGQDKGKPLFFLNNHQINIEKVYINPQRIDSIGVSKKTGTGELHFFTRNEKFNYYNIADVLRKFAGIKSSENNIVVKIDNKLIKDTSSIQIDKSFYIYTTTDSLEKVEYISKEYKNLILININLEKEKRNPKIFIGH